jgi:hypothetical protein
MPNSSTSHDQSHHVQGAGGTHVMPDGTVMKDARHDHAAHAASRQANPYSGSTGLGRECQCTSRPGGRPAPGGRHRLLSSRSRR